MTGTKLLSANYGALLEPFPRANRIEDRIALLAEMTNRNVCKSFANRDPCGDYDHVICTTVASHLVMQTAPYQDQFLRQITAVTTLPPMTMVKAYECAGWGYVLRFLGKHGRSRNVLLTIVDVDIHGLSFWRHHPMWERSGFGILTLVLRLGDDIRSDLEADAVPKANALIGFARTLARFADKRRGKKIFSPFFPNSQWTTFQRALGCLDLAGNRHDKFGHCFGSDPWVNLICGVKSGNASPGEKVITASLSLSGYYALAEVEIAGDFVAEIGDLTR